MYQVETRDTLLGSFPIVIIRIGPVSSGFRVFEMVPDIIQPSPFHLTHCFRNTPVI
jgi:hypothetical protein